MRTKFILFYLVLLLYNNLIKAQNDSLTANKKYTFFYEVAYGVGFGYRIYENIPGNSVYIAFKKNEIPKATQCLNLNIGKKLNKKFSLILSLGKYKNKYTNNKSGKNSNLIKTITHFNIVDFSLGSKISLGKSNKFAISASIGLIYLLGGYDDKYYNNKDNIQQNFYFENIISPFIHFGIQKQLFSLKNTDGLFSISCKFAPNLLVVEYKETYLSNRNRSLIYPAICLHLNLHK